MQYAWKKNEGIWVNIAIGVKRKVLARGKELSIVYLKFDKGGGSLKDFHQHEHAQVTYVLSGKFIFNVDGKQIEVKAGDSLYNPPNKKHTAICVEKGKLLDVFSPIRLDYLHEKENNNFK